MTPYGLWALKRGLLTDQGNETPAMRRGRLLEPIALQLLQEEKPDWVIAPHPFYYRDGALRLGASPDALASRPDISRHRRRPAEDGSASGRSSAAGGTPTVRSRSRCGSPSKHPSRRR